MSAAASADASSAVSAVASPVYENSGALMVLKYMRCPQDIKRSTVF